METRLDRPANGLAEQRAKPGPDMVPEPGASGAASMLRLQQSAGNQAVCAMLDVLTEGDEAPDGPFLDALGQRPLARNGDAGTGAPVADGGTGTDGGTPPVAAVPTNLQQIVTGWTPGPDKYGFQVKFRVSSSSGSVADLQAQPNLKWREYVTYSRNDFKHRIDPPSPTILPPGGIGFTAATTTVINANTLEFNNAKDTHWMPKSAVREADFATGSGRSLPAIMQSSQLYQFSTDGSAWTAFAGPTALTREFGQELGPAQPGQTMPKFFTTTKAGVHTVTEPYKP